MKFACHAAARRRDGSVKQDHFSLQKYLNSLQTIMQPAILHIIYFTAPAPIIPLTLLHTKLEPVTGPADGEGMKYIAKKKAKKGILMWKAVGHPFQQPLYMCYTKYFYLSACLTLLISTLIWFSSGHNAEFCTTLFAVSWVEKTC